MSVNIEAVYEDGVLKPGVPLALPEHARVRLTIEVDAPAALSELGQRLSALREDVVRSGTPLLDWDGIEAEVASRRGGWREDV